MFSSVFLIIIPRFINRRKKEKLTVSYLCSLLDYYFLFLRLF